MKLVEKISPTTYNPSRINQMYNNGQIFIDNSFQRRYVWEEKHKIALIETILLGYDIPAIYLWQQTPDPATGEIRYSVIDGQQRIGAIIGFLNNEFPLTKKHLIAKEDAEWDNKYFSELPDRFKQDIWSYQLNVNEVSRDVSLEEIKTMFLRLNITNKMLNPQELRNAQFNGKFIALALELAELDFWRNNKVFSVNDIRRMKDVEFLSHILIFLRYGMKTPTSQTTINKAYDFYNNEYKEFDEDKITVISILNDIQLILNALGAENSNRICKTTHIYTLFVVMYALRLENYFGLEKDLAFERVTNFFKLYINNDFSNNNVLNYFSCSQDAVASVYSRQTRYDSIINFIKSNI